MQIQNTINLESFFAYTKIQHHSQVKKLRVDNGWEFSSMLNFFNNEGVVEKKYIGIFSM